MLDRHTAFLRNEGSGNGWALAFPAGAQRPRLAHVRRAMATVLELCLDVNKRRCISFGYGSRAYCMVMGEFVLLDEGGGW